MSNNTDWTFIDASTIGDAAKESGLYSLLNIQDIFSGTNICIRDDISSFPEGEYYEFAKDFWAHEFRASCTSYASLRDHGLYIDDPFSPCDLKIRPTYQALLPKSHDADSFIELFRYETTGGPLISVFPTITGRLSILIIPTRRVVIHNRHASLTRHLATLMSRDPDCDSIVSEDARWQAIDYSKTIAIVDFPLNYAHQLLNGLGSFDRIIRYELQEEIDRLWIRGLEFYGDTLQYFPEFNDKVSVFRGVESLAEAFYSTPYYKQRIGSCHLSASLKSRLLSPLCTVHFRSIPIILLTIRGGNRRCVNLVDVLSTIVNNVFEAMPTAQFLFDGYVFAEPELRARSPLYTYGSSSARQAIHEELLMSEQVLTRAPNGAIFHNMIGWSISSTLPWVSQVRAAFTHVGTLHHKTGYFSSATCLIHGPASQLEMKDFGHFLAESKSRNYFLDPLDVEDVRQEESVSDTRKGVADYIIKKPQDVANRFTLMALESCSAP